MARHGTGAQVKVRLYMEGRLVENAFISVMTQGSVGQPATAQIELVPTNTIKHIMPLTWVHVFVTDPWEQNPAGDLSDYKLLFEGVVMSRGFTKTHGGRSFVIQCADPSIFWTSARQFWMNIASSNGNIIDQLVTATSGGYGTFGTLTTTGSFGYMASKLAFQERDNAEDTFLDTMIAVLDDVGNVNPYYTNARNRYRITDRIIRGPAGKTDQLFQMSLLSEFIDGLAGRTSGQSNLAQVVNELLTAILHEWVSIPAPPYIRTRIFDRDAFGNIKRTKTTVTRKGVRGRRKVDLYDYRTAEDYVVGSMMFKPDVYTISPPACNVLFPNMYDHVSYTENFMAETTRLSMRPQLMMFDKVPQLTSLLMVQRPTELETFAALVRDPQRGTSKQRTPDGKYADGAGQTPTFNDYDWATNEERIRGIVYNFMNLAPAPSTLSLQEQGKKNAQRGNRGIRHFLQNVGSYEYYKSKYVARQSSIKGPFNIRPVPGFPILVLDDSEAQMNMVAQLAAISHNIDSSGAATTTYQITTPRLLDEVDYNRPRFKGGYTEKNELDFDLFRDEHGNYDFAKVFDGANQPPVPEWFDESYANVVDLNLRYKEWFGSGVAQKILLEGTGLTDSETIQEALDAALASIGSEGSFSSIGEALESLDSDEDREKFEEALQVAEDADLQAAADELNARFRLARNDGREFNEASSYTARAFTKIDEAFRFVGAGPLELANRGLTTDGSAVFLDNVAANRTIDYKNVRLDVFIGDTSPGSGYSAVPESDKADEGTTMSGAFPIFDTIPHTGDAATNQAARDALATGDESAPSTYPRYDGRPLMYDFELRLWQESLAAAGFAPTEESIQESAEGGKYTVVDDRGNLVEVKTAEEQAEIRKIRAAAIAQRNREYASRKKRGRNDPRPRKTRNLKPKDQAPTGKGLEQGELNALPQPLSEKQVIDLRRSVIDAYRKELERTRGFTG